MPKMSATGPLAHRQREQPAAGDWARRAAGWMALAAAVGVAYFLAARLSVGLVLKPEGVAVFWPAAGISTGVLIALGPRARWPVAAGVTLATIAIHQLIDDPLWAGTALGLCNAAEALITAGLIEFYFGADFAIDRLYQVLGLLVAAIVGTAVSGIGGAATYRLLAGPSALMLTTWQHWFVSDAIGVVIVAPLVIGLGQALRHPPAHGELVEGMAALAVLVIMTGIALLLPAQAWETVLPVALLFPVLLWMAARCRPVFAAAAAFLVSIAVVATAVFGIGHFGDIGLPLADRILQAQATILFVAFGAYVLAALFAERRDSEARLATANTMLERERDNKLMSAQAITGTIAHEVRQPLAAIVASAGAALRWLDRTPPDYGEVRAALELIQSEGHRTSEVFDAIRALFRKSDQKRQRIDVNEIIGEVLQTLRGELKQHAVEVRTELGDMPHVEGHPGQLREVLFNLAHNAIEAMDATTGRARRLQVTSELRGDDAIVVGVGDTGPGIDPQRIDGLFRAFLTTKSEGMGLGLAICHMIVQQHGGQLTASSDGKSGTLFKFVLPTASSDEASEAR